MNEIQLELTQLLWKQELIFGRFIKPKQYLQMLCYQPTLSDLHRWMNENEIHFFQRTTEIVIQIPVKKWVSKKWYYTTAIKFDTNKDLLDQDEDTLNQIIKLIKTNS